MTSSFAGSFLGPFTVAIAHHLWQSTLFAIAIGALTLSFRRNSASIRHALWLAASLKFLVPFALLAALGARIHASVPWQFGPHDERGVAASTSLVSPFISVFDGVVAPLASSTTAMQAVAVAPAHGDVALRSLAVAWALGAMSVLAFWFVRWRRVRRALRESKQADLAFPIPVRRSDTLLEPGIVGVLRPVLLLPAGIEQRLTSAQLRAVLAHEQCHVRRRDNLAAALHMLVEVTFWFHPLVWWLGARLIAEREQACDEHVTRSGHEPGTYAEGILNVCQHYLESRLPLVAGVSGADLRKRIEEIMKNAPVSRVGAIKKTVLAVATFAALLVPVAVGLFSSPMASAQAAAVHEDADSYASVRIRLTPAGTTASNLGFDPYSNGFLVGNYSLHRLIEFAYDVDAARVTGPDWLATTHFDIRAQARAASVSTVPQFERLNEHIGEVRKFLEDRFGLVVTHTTSRTSGFALTVAEGGSKLVPMAGGFQSYFDERTNVVVANGLPVAFLLKQLSNRLGVPVVDETGLKQTYAIRLAWGPDGSPPAAPPEAIKLTPQLAAEVLSDQLGLQLERRAVDVGSITVVSVRQPGEVVTGELAVTPREYESVSIQLAAADAKGESIAFEGLSNTFGSKNRPLRGLIAMAYGVDEQQIVGGAWLDSPRLDFVGQAGPSWSAGPDDVVNEHRPMVRAVLEKQFGLVVRRDRPDTDAYVLSVAPGGSKLAPSSVGLHPSYDFNKNGFDVKGLPVTWLSRSLRELVNAPVVDQTALAGNFDLKLQWGPSVSNSDPGPRTTPTPQRLSELLQKTMGLRLERRRMPIEQLTVLSVRPPSEVATPNLSAANRAP